MFMSVSKSTLAIIFLVIIHIVGFVGTAFFDESMMKLTPVNLLVSLGIVLWFHKQPNAYFLAYLIVVYLFGFAIEWAGVETGKIFGQYFYGENLGIKILDIPLIIGINWVMLSYCAMNIAGLLYQSLNLKVNQILIPFVASLLMVFADFWIEQLCSRFDFWYWKSNIIPLQNYTAWFFFSFAFNYLYFKLDLPTNNKIAVVLYALQLFFFIGLGILLN